ncbi:HPr(Ser) kinase/phosphatase [Malacoplasma muris]|uniref:HPr(Ser) kinase/phosphatase n=1 Tax=Malacoplasma muris TaxID=2119 RepID=UPI00398E3FCB
MNWKNIIDKFDFKVEHVGFEKEIKSTRMTRTGLELSGYFSLETINACILWGKEEFNYLETFDLNTKIKKVENIFKLAPPVVILSRSFAPTHWLINLATIYNITIISTSLSSSDINTRINLFLSESLSKSITIHGNLLEIYGQGVMIIGESGMGKSETTIELVKDGHLFIADDAIECKKIFDKVMGSPSPIAKGFMEVRGLGIIDVARLFGIEKIKESTHIDVIIELVEFKPNIHNFERLGKDLQYKEIHGIKIPYYLVPVTSGKKISDLIEVIVANLKLIQSGYNSFNEFIQKSKEIK